MGKVFKKKPAQQRKRVNEEEVEDVAKLSKKQKKEEEVVEEAPVDDVEDEEDSDDEEEDDVDDEENGSDGETANEILDFDFEGFPLEEDDRDGVINMLTQTFLRTDIDLRGIAEALIAQAPCGTVIGPAETDADEDDKNVVNALCTVISLNAKRDALPKYAKDINLYLTNKAKKLAPKPVVRKLEEIFASEDNSTAFFINERMLNFPSLVVPQLFAGMRSDLEQSDASKTFKNIIYIQKIRKTDAKEEVSVKPKRKMGKAEKKRLAETAECELKFDNPEDELLFVETKGTEIHFDYPVHMDVEAGSKFHIVEEDGKKWNPFRRLVIMDFERFEAFLRKGEEF